jgi:hypothetical protein
MPDNQLIFPLGPALTGLTAELRVRLLLPTTGDVDPLAPPLTVTESTAVPGLYRATMAGAAGSYGAVLLRVVGASEVFVASVGTFRWDGAAFVAAATASDVQLTPVTLTVTGQFDAIAATNLAALRAVAEADEAITPTRYQKLAAGTQTVLVDKDVLDSGDGTVTLVQRP